MTRLRVVIVDDEPLAREGIRRLLEAEPDISIVGECSDGIDAIEVIGGQSPDLVFLDVQMPEAGGFDVVRAIEPAKLPLIIFVTAYDEFAIRAFDVHAIDYILKPLVPARFCDALNRARAAIREKRMDSLTGRLLPFLESLEQKSGAPGRIAVKVDGKIVLIAPHEISRIEAEGDYVRIYTSGTQYFVRGKIGEFEERLAPHRIVRVHRSTLVNLDFVKELEPQFAGDYVIHLLNGSKLVLSRSYREKVLSLLK